MIQRSYKYINVTEETIELTEGKVYKIKYNYRCCHSIVNREIIGRFIGEDSERLMFDCSTEYRSNIIYVYYLDILSVAEIL